MGWMAYITLHELESKRRGKLTASAHWYIILHIWVIAELEEESDSAGIASKRALFFP